MFSQITTLTTGDFDNVHKINGFRRLHRFGQIFERSIFLHVQPFYTEP